MAARVSLCLMVKNEETNLPTCLSSAADLVHEMIVVDTGSTDRTKEVAASLGARVFDFAWVDSFAAARNESLRHASGDWIFWLDGDEYLDEANRQKVRVLFANLGDENAAYSMKQCSAPEIAGGSGLFRRSRGSTTSSHRPGEVRCGCKCRQSVGRGVPGTKVAIVPAAGRAGRGRALNRDESYAADGDRR